MYSQRAAISFGKKTIRQDQYKLNELKAGIIDRASFTPSVLHISLLSSFLQSTSKILFPLSLSHDISLFNPFPVLIPTPLSLSTYFFYSKIRFACLALLFVYYFEATFLYLVFLYSAGLKKSLTLNPISII